MGRAKLVDKPSKIPVECDLCKKIYSDRSTLAWHVKQVHGEKEILPELECGTCYKVFQKKAFYMKHISNCEEKRTKPELKCNICSRVFLKKAFFEKHFQRAHNDYEKLYKCDICEMCFNEKSKLHAHSHNMHKKKNCSI